MANEFLQLPNYAPRPLDHVHLGDVAKSVGQLLNVGRRPGVQGIPIDGRAFHALLGTERAKDSNAPQGAEGVMSLGVQNGDLKARIKRENAAPEIEIFSEASVTLVKGFEGIVGKLKKPSAAIVMSEEARVDFDLREIAMGASMALRGAPQKFEEDANLDQVNDRLVYVSHGNVAVNTKGPKVEVESIVVKRSGDRMSAAELAQQLVNNDDPAKNLPPDFDGTVEVLSCYGSVGDKPFTAELKKELSNLGYPNVHVSGYLGISRMSERPDPSIPKEDGKGVVNPNVGVDPFVHTADLREEIAERQQALNEVWNFVGSIPPQELTQEQLQKIQKIPRFMHELDKIVSLVNESAGEMTEDGDPVLPKYMANLKGDFGLEFHGDKNAALARTSKVSLLHQLKSVAAQVQLWWQAMPDVPLHDVQAAVSSMHNTIGVLEQDLREPPAQIVYTD